MPGPRQFWYRCCSHQICSLSLLRTNPPALRSCLLFCGPCVLPVAWGAPGGRNPSSSSLFLNSFSLKAVSDVAVWGEIVPSCMSRNEITLYQEIMISSLEYKIPSFNPNLAIDSVYPLYLIYMCINDNILSQKVTIQFVSNNLVKRKWDLMGRTNIPLTSMWPWPSHSTSPKPWFSQL